MDNHPISLDISLDYLNDESLKGNFVLDWIKDYTLRNYIPFLELDEHVQLLFKSDYQLEWFQRKGNTKYPYFEF